MKSIKNPFLWRAGKLTGANILLTQVAERFVKSERRHRLWAERTEENYRVLMKHYAGFAPNVRLKEVNEEWTEGFVTYLYGTMNLRNSTILTLIQQHRAVLRWAKGEGYKIGRDALSNFPHLKNVNNRSEVVALTQEEFRRLRELRIENAALRVALDIFCFCCHTSLRFSDVMRLKWCNVNGGWIEIVTQKTNEQLRIPLGESARRILEGYKPQSRRGKEGYSSCIFPRLSLMNYNRNLKRVAKLAGLDRMITETWFCGAERHEVSRPLHEVISSHVGRKTFVTLALSSGMPVDILCTFTGHRDSKQLIYYYNITREEQLGWMLHLEGKCNQGWNEQTNNQSQLNN